MITEASYTSESEAHRRAQLLIMEQKAKNGPAWKPAPTLSGAFVNDRLIVSPLTPDQAVKFLSSQAGAIARLQDELKAIEKKRSMVVHALELAAVIERQIVEHRGISWSAWTSAKAEAEA